MAQQSTLPNLSVLRQFGSSAVYDRRGRQTTNSQPGMVFERTLDASGVLLAETHAEGLLQGLSLSLGYDQFLRRTNASLLAPGSQLLASTTNSFGRTLKVIGSGAVSATYSYLANSALVEQISFANNGAAVMNTVKSYDALNRLTNIVSSTNGVALSKHGYLYNAANQRTRATLVDNSYWVYSYDSLGQVTSGRKYWSDGTPVAGQQFDYTFDTIGNRRSASSGGDEFRTSLRESDYSVNALNQYTNRTVPGFVNVIGSANASATVSLWGDNGSFSPTSRKGDFFRGELTANNSTGAIWLTITNVAVLKSGNTDIITNTIGKALVAKTPQAFAYDLDGNLTSDGNWAFTWDGENRLLTATNLSSLPSPSRKALTFTYDSLSRRTSKTVYTNNGSGFMASYTNYFVYDGWNLVSILGPQSTVLQSFNWGTDLSGSLQGAGGVGGLLAMKVHSGANAGTYFYSYDGNGNVMALVNVADGSLAAQYEYGPFGEVLRATGPMATANPFRFSTKFQDDETDLFIYPYRPYSPSLGRWFSRDPIEENGGLNLYSFVLNSPTGSVDPLGLDHNTPPCTLLFGDLAYSSEGKAYRDPDIVVNFPHVTGGSAIWYSSESGKKSDPSAYYGQTAFGLRGGLCNSCTPNPSSFVKAYAINRGCCCVRGAFTCNAAFVGIKYGGAIVPTTGRPIPGNVTVVGHVLDQAVTPTETRQSNLSTSFVTSISVFSKIVSLEKNMPSREMVPLYELSAPIAFQVGSGGGFSEFMAASCSARIIGPCK